MKNKFDVSGMSCSACSSAVERAVRKLDGVEDVSVNLLSNSMQVDFDESKVSSDEIEKAVDKAGYSATLKNDKNTKSKNVDKEDLAEKEIKNMKFRLVVSFAFLIPLMYVAMGHMVNFPLPKFLLGHEMAVNFAFTQFLLVLPIMYVNRKYYINGFKSLYRKNPNMDSLIAIGSSSAIVFGIYVIYKLSFALGMNDHALLHRYYHNLYFESGGMILALITFGKYLETLSKGKTKDSVKKLMDLSPKTAIVVRDEKELEINVEEVVKGDILIIKPGSRVPVDGKIIEGFGMFDTSSITGESIPQEKNVSDNLLTSSILKQGNVKMIAEKVGDETTLSQIINLVEIANETKPKIAKLADKIAGIFVPSVIFISLVTFLVWIFVGKEFEFALEMAISVLVISCPCALGLATPVAIMVSTGKGAREGLLIKSSEALENLDKINVVVFDKTGTLTEGKPVVTDIVSNGMNEDDFLEILYSLESKSEHPLGLAVCEYAKSKNIKLLNVTDFINKLGLGVEGIINGKKYYLGNLKYIANGNKLQNELNSYFEEFSSQGKTVIFLKNDDCILGFVAIADKIKESSKNAINHLKNMNIQSIMLTGDNERVAKNISEKLNLDGYFSGLLPQDKEKIIKNMISENKKVAMVGDGINDSPALAGANVGIAVGNGTDIAIEAADVVLIKNDITDVVNLINLSKKTIRNIKENLFWAFIYNILCIPLAMGVFYIPFKIALSPMIGSVAMSFSSIFVVLNALRLNKFRKMDSLKVTEKVAFKLEKVEFKKINIERIESEVIKMKKVLIIEGMMCGHCKKRVEDSFNKIEGISAVVNLDEKSCTLEMTKEFSNEELKEIVENAGYELLEVR